MISKGQRRSVKLSKWEHSELKKIRKNYSTAVECAEFFGVPRSSFDRIILFGSGSEDYIALIKAKLN